MKKTIVMDVDGVLLDYHTEFCKYFNLEEYCTNGNWYDDFEGAFGFGLPAIHGMVLEFNSSDTFTNLLPRENCVEYIKKLIHHGFDIHLVTSCGATTTIKEARLENLKNVFGEDTFKSISTIDLGENKKQYLKQFKGSGFMWIEDTVRNYYTGEDLGLHSVLIKTPFNYHTHELNMVNNWDELYHYIVNWYQVYNNN